ncbi:hypothetical protein GCM10009646_68330 [Streptomyces aureus]
MLTPETDHEMYLVEKLGLQRLHRGDPAPAAPQIHTAHAALPKDTEQPPRPEDTRVPGPQFPRQSLHGGRL